MISLRFRDGAFNPAFQSHTPARCLLETLRVSRVEFLKERFFIERKNLF